jgi:transposase
MAILHRKNSMGYKTQNGARLGDMFMSLIHTCRLGAVNPLDYLNALQRHAKQALEHPTRWLPWNYEQALSPFDTG